MLKAKNQRLTANSQKPKANFGFTLTELLVVISIISILAISALFGINRAQIRARDARRIADLEQISVALEMYRQQVGGYAPDIGCIDSSIGWGCGSLTQGSWNPTEGLQWLVIRGFLQSLPVDPINNATFNYRYEPGCHMSPGPAPHTKGYAQGYVLSTQLEATNSTHTIRKGQDSVFPACQAAGCRVFVDAGVSSCH